MEVSDTLLRSLKGRRMSDAEIARATGMPEHAVRERVAELYARQNAGSLSPQRDPTPLSIMLEASAIRLKWSPAEERKRRGCIDGGIVPPDASPDFCRLVADRCGRNQPWRRSTQRHG